MPLTWVFLTVSGVVAGIVGTAGGITSLVAYPALLAAGIGPLAANITCSVALIGSGLGSTVRAGPDLHDHRGTVLRWVPPAAAFSLLGAVLLVATPGAVFDRIVPFLVAAGALIVLFQPRIAAWQNRAGRHIGPLTVMLSGGVVALYNGYFGAGSGILLIALLLSTSEPVLHRANSLKNVLLLAADVLPAALFVILGRVVWSAMWPLGIGAVVGGLIGPSITRRLPAGVLRVLIACCGLGLAVWLLLDT